MNKNNMGNKPVPSQETLESSSPEQRRKKFDHCFILEEVFFQENFTSPIRFDHTNTSKMIANGIWRPQTSKLISTPPHSQNEAKKKLKQ
ncbi:hypothetical protein NPIL_27251 [Nephila pilipes]|uniref:Uncharacterized protein n=1 Tax=Nephila pilipes TaxID=299642 RepID=A0A8X6Q5T0_NEPPI|nr:hypothetical protein NPIL_27251 [Nephila pilipes]